MAVKVLGPLDTGAGPLSPRERVVLSALIVRQGSAVTPTELAEACWGEAPPPTWTQQVKTSVARIRTRLGREAIETVGSAYQLGLDPDAIDAVRFERLVSSARQHALHEEYDRAIDAYRRAVALWRGAALPDLAAWEPGVVEAMRLGEIRKSAEEEMLDTRLRTGEHRSVVADAERLVREEPLREDRWATLALANYQSDRQAEALAVLRAARTRLADDLGVEPGARLTRLETAILRHDPALAPVTPLPRVSDDCPYPGLRAFGEADADEFFGRASEVEAVLDRLHPGSVVAISGSSGSGKSSLMRAGVLPRLTATRGRSTLLIRPGAGAVETMREAAGPSRDVDVIAVDQVEELFSASEADIADFCAAARAYLDHDGTIVLTIRSDFLDRAIALPHIGSALGRDVFLLGPLDDDAMRAAVEGPARRVGLRLESGLVDVILRDAGSRSTTLPHLSHALLETWVRREGGILTIGGYEASGGIAGAIAQSAEELYRALPPHDQQICRSMMLRLIERGADGASVRRRVNASQLLADSSRRRVADALVRSRLLIADGDAIIIAHEAVASAWPRLDGWLAEDADSARLTRQLEEAAASWNASGREIDDLWRGARLQAALEWRMTSSPDLTPVEADFLDASVERNRGEVELLVERARRDKVQNRRLRTALTGAAALLVVALVSGGIAIVRGGEAARTAEDARIEALVSTSLSLQDSDRDVAALLAAEAYRRWPDDPRARVALMGSMTQSEGYVGTAYIPDTVNRIGAALIPGTDSAVIVRDWAHVEIRDSRTGALERSMDASFPQTDDWIRPWVRVSADASTLGVMHRHQTAAGEGIELGDQRESEFTFFDVASGRQLAAPARVAEYAEDFELSTDGSLATWISGVTGDLHVARTATGEVSISDGFRVDAPSDLRSAPAVATFASDGRVVIGTYAGEILVVDPDTFDVQQRHAVPVGTAQVDILALPDGRVIAGGTDGLVAVDLETGTVLWTQQYSDGRLLSCGYLTASARNAEVYCGDFTGGVQRRSLDDGEVRGATLAFPHGTGGDLALTADDTELVLLSGQKPALGRWRIDGSGPASSVIAAGEVLIGGYDPTGRYLLTIPDTTDTGGDETWDIGVWDAESDREVLRLDDVWYATWAADARATVWAPPDEVPYFIDAPSGARHADSVNGPQTEQIFPSAYSDLAYSLNPVPDLDDVWELWTIDAVANRRLEPTFRVDGYPTTVSPSPDGRRVAITWWSGGPSPWTTSVFDARSGELIVAGLHAQRDAVISADDELIGSNPDRLTRFDLDTLEQKGSLPGSPGESSLQLSADGRTLLALTPGETRATLYDLDASRVLGASIRLGTLDQPEAWLHPDGRAMVHNSATGVIRWDLDPDHHFEAACRIAGRELSADEWATYLADVGPQRATCADVLG